MPVIKREAGVLGVLVTAFFLLLPLGCGKEEASGSKDDSKIVARVDGNAITLGRLDKALKVILPKGAGELTEDELSELRKSLLKEVIDEELILKEAASMGVAVSEVELLEEIAFLKKNYDKKGFAEIVIPRYGSINAWKDDVRRKLLIKKVIGEVRGSGVEVSDGEAKEYYEKNRDGYEVPEQVSAAMIFVQTKAEAEKVKGLLLNSDFEEVARAHSSGPEASSGGALGTFGRGDMPEEFEAAVFSLKKGEISGITTSPFGFHIFKLNSRMKGRKLSFEDVKEDIKEALWRDKADMEYRKWILELKEKTKIETLEDL